MPEVNDKFVATYLENFGKRIWADIKYNLHDQSELLEFGDINKVDDDAIYVSDRFVELQDELFIYLQKYADLITVLSNH